MMGGHERFILDILHVCVGEGGRWLVIDGMAQRTDRILTGEVNYLH